MRFALDLKVLASFDDECCRLECRARELSWVIPVGHSISNSVISQLGAHFARSSMLSYYAKNDIQKIECTVRVITGLEGVLETICIEYDVSDFDKLARKYEGG